MSCSIPLVVISIAIQLIGLTVSQNFGPGAQPSVYHAPARSIQAPNVHPEVRQQFLRLFRRDIHAPQIPHGTSLVDPAIIQEINQLCPRDAFFYSFAPRHLNATMLLYKEFMKMPGAIELFSASRNELSRKEINPRVWFFALQAAIFSRPDLNGYYLAWASDVAPDIFLPASVLNAAMASGSSTSNSRPRTCVTYNGTGGSSQEENRLWYFREDVMVNQHHWYWHQYFPLESRRHIDRRGEMFYFMHHQIIARYNAERLSNGLNIETAMDIRLGSNIGKEYNSDLVDRNSGKFWTPRIANTLLKDVMHGADPDFKLDLTIGELSNAYDILASHVADGILLANNPTGGLPSSGVPLDIRNIDGLNRLGDTFEASNKSVNPGLYLPHGIHNLAHAVVCLQSDPDYTYRLPPGVMGDTATAMRDPAFYKVHTFVDNLFDRHQRTLQPYQLHDGDWPLVWNGLEIQSLEVISNRSRVNLLETFWSTKRFPLEQGIDGNIHDGSVQADICHVHLNHESFTFQLTVDVIESAGRNVRNGMVRIFMAPRSDLNERRFSMDETRKLMFQLDAFSVPLRQGRNIITRDSGDSSSTKPWSRSLEDMLRDPHNGGQAEYCGCGWPDHLYIPKGTPEGMEFDLFVMITDFSEDRVQDSPENLRIPEACNSPYMLCGVPYRKYPDRRPMGYPFDRYPYSISNGTGAQDLRPVETLEEYVSFVPNMKSSVVTIKHTDAFSTQ